MGLRAVEQVTELDGDAKSDSPMAASDPRRSERYAQSLLTATQLAPQ